MKNKEIKFATNHEVLVFSPHPDDCEMFLGGSIKKLVNEGRNVCIVDLTEGEMSTRGNKELRSEEREEASKILGINSRYSLNLPDSSIYQDTELSKKEQISRVVFSIRKIKPKIIFAPYFENRHPDHTSSYNIIRDSLFYSNLKKYSFIGDLVEEDRHHVPTLMWYMCRMEFSPSLVIDITEVYDDKQKAIKCYKSQVISDKEDKDKTLVSNELSLSSLQGRDSYFGSMIGVKYGEALLLDSPCSVSNVSKFLESQDWVSPFIYKNRY